MKKASPINFIWLILILISVVTASYTGRMGDVTEASFESAKSAVTLAISLIGAMALWLGIMKILEAAGAMKVISKMVKPVMKFLFPEIPADHPAMGAIIMNISANMLGLANAATPLGIKAMKELDRINSRKGTATDAMCLFLAINTSSVTVLPLGVMTIRAAAGATSPASIILPSILATSVSTVTAVIAAKIFSRLNTLSNKSLPETDSVYKKNEEPKEEKAEKLILPSKSGRIVVTVLILALAGGIIYQIFTGNLPSSGQEVFTALSRWLIPLLICGFLTAGYFTGVPVYETLTEGAREGFDVAVRIIPFLVAIFVAIGMLRASGALGLFKDITEPVVSIIGMPSDAIPMALMRPLSGSGAFGIMSEIVNREPDSFLSFFVSTMQGSTETTFYVLAVYFGAVGISKSRHALPAALIADAAGIFAALFFCHLFWSPL